MKLKQFLASKALAEFLVTRVELDVASGGQKIATLFLHAPIPQVQGSQMVKDPVSNETARVIAYDVEYVKIAEDDFDAEGIDIDESGQGLVKTNELSLDVAKGSGEVWLKREKFSAFARGQRQNRADERSAGLMSKIKERQTKAAFKGVDVNQPVKPEVVAE